MTAAAQHDARLADDRAREIHEPLGREEAQQRPRGDAVAVVGHSFAESFDELGDEVDVVVAEQGVVAVDIFESLEALGHHALGRKDEFFITEDPLGRGEALGQHYDYLIGLNGLAADAGHQLFVFFAGGAERAYGDGVAELAHKKPSSMHVYATVGSICHTVPDHINIVLHGAKKVNLSHYISQKIIEKRHII